MSRLPLVCFLALASACAPSEEGKDPRPDEDDSAVVTEDDQDGDGALAADDCDDADADIHPGATEHCNGVDEDCDGVADDDAADATTWYIDYDADGYGVDGAFTATGCAATPGFVGNADDCDDEDAGISPDGVETCDGVDQDCDGTIDDDPVDGALWFEDADADGYGDPGSSVRACERVDGYTENAEDTDDADPSVPGVLFGDWTTLGNGPTHTGYFPGYVGEARLAPLWSLEVDGIVNPILAVGADVYVTVGLYFGEGFALSLDAATGDQQWRYDLPEANSVNPATWYDDKLYFQRGNHSGDTHLWCLDAAEGDVLWRSPHSAQWEHYYAPTIADGKVWVNGGSYGGLYGFDADDGDELFFTNLAQYDEWTPAYDDGVVYAWVAGTFSAHDPSTGVLLWELELGWDWHGYDMDTAPVIAGGIAYVAGSLGLHAVDLETESLLWSVEGDASGVPTVANGIVYVIVDGAVEAYGATDGEYRRIFIGDDDFLHQPIATDDMLIVASSADTYVFDIATGERVDQVEGGGWVSVARGRLYVATESSEIRAFAWAR